MPFDQKLLDDLRAAVPVSEVVSRKHKLRREGLELVLADDPSIGISDKKARWFDNGSNKRNGDVFEWLVEFEGFSFPDAVEEIARIAGIAVQSGRPNVARANDRSVGEIHSDQRGRHDASDDVHAVGKSPRAERRIAATYDYQKADGAFAYQVVRWEPKRFSQRRRPVPEDAPEKIKRDNWVWNLEGVTHTLYGLPALIADMREERRDQSTWFLCEGEKDVETLRAWGMSATTNSGGAQHFTKALAKFFADAADLIVLEDGDAAGAKRTLDIVPMLQEYGARVRVLRLADHHTDKPKDVTQWRDECGGSEDALYGLIADLGEWTPPPPPPFESRFGAKTFVDLGGVAKPYLWRIKGLIPMKENILVMGPSRSGKTFEVLDMAMHVVLGQPFAGRRVDRCGVAYCSYEGQSGFENRLRAYLKHWQIAPDDIKHFAWWTRPPQLFADEEHATALAADICAVTKNWDVPLGVIVVDTHNAATRGSSEIKSEDISRVLERYETISEKTGAPLWLVGHTNNEGHHRGNQQFFNRIDTTILIERVTEGKGQNEVDRRDDNHRVLRRASVEKQRDGADGVKWEFVLQEITIGVDFDGEPIQSMVSVEPARAGDVDQRITQQDKRKSVAHPPGTWVLNGGEETFFRAMLQALGNAGVPPPSDLMKDGERLTLPRSVGQVVSWQAIQTVYRSMIPIDDETKDGMKRRRDRIKTAMQRARAELHKRNVIGIGQVGVEAEDKAPTFYIWPGGRPVAGDGLRWPEHIFAAAAQQAAAIKPDPVPIDEATGEPMEDVPL